MSCHITHHCCYVAVGCADEQVTSIAFLSDLHIEVQVRRTSVHRALLVMLSSQDFLSLPSFLVASIRPVVTDLSVVTVAFHEVTKRSQFSTFNKV